MAALRVAVCAPRDGELRALAVELAATRRAHSDLTVDNVLLQQRVDTTVALNTDNGRLRRQLAESQEEVRRMRHKSEQDESNRIYLNGRLTLGANDLARWAAVREEKMPLEVGHAILATGG